MANSAQARKRARQADKCKLQNASQRSNLRTAMKKVINAIDAGDKDGASEAYRSAVPAIDKGVGKGLLHLNAASRYKSRLNTRIRAM